MKVAIVNYGMGNIYSIQSALHYLGCLSVYTNQRDILSEATHIILPGVGSFKKAMYNLKESGLDRILTGLVLTEKKPLLGICLGMQLLGKSSPEDGFTEGLGLIDGVVEKFSSHVRGIKIPHVGFNEVRCVRKDSVLLKDFEGNSDFYFTHSYRMVCSDGSCSGETVNGENFAASVERSNVFGTQFHPEKSQANGLKLLVNFLKNT